MNTQLMQHTTTSPAAVGVSSPIPVTLHTTVPVPHHHPAAADPTAFGAALQTAVPAPSPQAATMSVPSLPLVMMHLCLPVFNPPPTPPAACNSGGSFVLAAGGFNNTHESLASGASTPVLAVVGAPSLSSAVTTLTHPPLVASPRSGSDDNTTEQSDHERGASLPNTPVVQISTQQLNSVLTFLPSQQEPSQQTLMNPAAPALMGHTLAFAPLQTQPSSLAVAAHHALPSAVNPQQQQCTPEQLQLAPFSVTPPKISSAAQGGPSSDTASVPTAWLEHLVQGLRGQPADVCVRDRTRGVPKEQCRAIAVYLVERPSLMWQLLAMERGAVVASVVERLGGDDVATRGLVQYVVSNTVELAKTKGGCVALPRVMQQVEAEDRAAAFAQLRTLPDAATHQYANFVLQYFVGGGVGENGLGTEGKTVLPLPAEFCGQLINGELRDLQTFLRWSTSKCGSQVVDRVIRNASADDLRVLLTLMFSDQAVVASMAEHSFGHFNLKTAFEAIVDGQLKGTADQAVLLHRYYAIAQRTGGRYHQWFLRLPRKN